jgi:hypothetical protein
MMHLELQQRFYVLLREQGIAGVARLLDEHPELVSTAECAAHNMHHAAMAGNTTLVALLVEKGVDVNIPESPAWPIPPLYSAVSLDQVDTARWLIEHGSVVNYEWNGKEPWCMPLVSAIRHGPLEMVRLLVEAGGQLNVLDRRNMTPLSWAIALGRDEVAAYLRSKGALEAHEVPGYVPPPPPDPVPDHVAAVFAPVQPLAWLPIVPDGDPPVAVRVATRDDGVVCLFTDGMSARPMPPGPGGDAYQYAELAVYLSGWPDDPAGWTEPEYLWPVTWLRRLARYPFETGAGLGGPVAVVANGDPPQPLGPNTAMTCWLLLADKDPLGRLETPDGRDVVFYEMVPIHTAERDFEREHGTEALLEKFAERGVPEYLDPARPSVV